MRHATEQPRIGSGTRRGKLELIETRRGTLELIDRSSAIGECVHMARQARHPFDGDIYHVLNRGTH